MHFYLSKTKNRLTGVFISAYLYSTPISTHQLPVIRKRYFEHSLAHTKASRAALRTLATTLTLIRTSMDISRKDLARRVGISINTLNHIENAENFPSMAVYLAICRELKLEKPPLT